MAKVAPDDFGPILGLGRDLVRKRVVPRDCSAAKAGIVGLAKAAAKEVPHHGVRVDSIQPGLVRTAMTEAMPQQAWDRKMAEIPMRRAGDVSEIASVALFLASDLPSYLTGTMLEVAGGRFM